MGLQCAQFVLLVVWPSPAGSTICWIPILDSGRWTLDSGLWILGFWTGSTQSEPRGVNPVPVSCLPKTLLSSALAPQSQRIAMLSRRCR